MFEKDAEKRTEEKYTCSKKEIMPLEAIGYKKGFKDGAEFGYNLAKEEIDYLNQHWRNGKSKVNEWHYCKDELPPIGETVLLFYGSDAMGKVVMSTGSIDCKGNWYKNVDDTPIMWQSINLPSNKNIANDYLYCDNQLLPDEYVKTFGFM